MKCGKRKCVFRKKKLSQCLWFGNIYTCRSYIRTRNLGRWNMHILFAHSVKDIKPTPIFTHLLIHYHHDVLFHFSKRVMCVCVYATNNVFTPPNPRPLSNTRKEPYIFRFYLHIWQKHTTTHIIYIFRVSAMLPIYSITETRKLDAKSFALLHFRSERIAFPPHKIHFRGKLTNANAFHIPKFIIC